MEYVKGLVSVVIPTYKRSDMLCRAIDSVLNQTYDKVECIVVNDNNPGDEYSKNLYTILLEYKNNKHFRFIEQAEHKNGAAARNVGIRSAKGEYIAFLDDDDFWDSNKLEVQVAALKELPDEWGAVSCLMRFYKDGVVCSASTPYKDGNIHYEVLTRCISMGTGSLLIRRKALDATGYFDETLKRYQDPQVFSCLTERYRVKLIKRYLHNRDIDDAQNRPSVYNINSFQQAFLNSVSDQLERLPRRKRKQVKAIYGLDKFSVYWHGGQKIKSLSFLFELFKYPGSIKMALIRIVRRVSDRHCIEYRLNKYKY